VSEASIEPGRTPPPLGLLGTTVLFGGGAVLLYGATRWLIPALAERTSLEPVLLWFLAAGFGVFLPLLLVAAVLLHREGAFASPHVWRDRLRFHAMNRGDWHWSLGGLTAIGLLAFGGTRLLRFVGAEQGLQPSFLMLEPLGPGRYWILAAWLPFFVLNILGKEVLWHGVLLPRQETAFGHSAWLVNGIGWLLFHLPFGPTLLLVLAPTTLIVPYVVQRRRNSWIGVVLHGGLNGPGFLAVAFGLI
jgi:membrane protease YdiL (CAAX protease family)